jgi:hypothetical protein
MTGANFFLVVGPLVFFGLIVFWITLTIYANFHMRRIGPRQDLGKRGVVAGGIIEGSPAQLSRRDEAPRHDS